MHDTAAARLCVYVGEHLAHAPLSLMRCYRAPVAQRGVRQLRRDPGSLKARLYFAVITAATGGDYVRELPFLDGS